MPSSSLDFIGTQLELYANSATLLLSNFQVRRHIKLSHDQLRAIVVPVVIVGFLLPGLGGFLRYLSGYPNPAFLHPMHTVLSVLP